MDSHYTFCILKHFLKLNYSPLIVIASIICLDSWNIRIFRNKIQDPVNFDTRGFDSIHNSGTIIIFTLILMYHTTQLINNIFSFYYVSF